MNQPETLKFDVLLPVDLPGQRTRQKSCPSTRRNGRLRMEIGTPTDRTDVARCEKLNPITVNRTDNAFVVKPWRARYFNRPVRPQLRATGSVPLRRVNGPAVTHYLPSLWPRRQGRMRHSMIIGQPIRSWPLRPTCGLGFLDTARKLSVIKDGSLSRSCSW
jgi:hypothetical protein